jgi:lipopolysaccharide export system protein LptA
MNLCPLRLSALLIKPRPAPRCLRGAWAGPALPWAWAGWCLTVLALQAPPAWAEKADRDKPMVLEADRSGSIDLQRQIFVYIGNAVITQGTMVMRADRIEARQTPDGYYVGHALGSAGKPATWRQRRDGVNETVEGSADRIEFDGRADTLRFLGNSAVRRLRSGVVADEITGGTIVWDNLTEVFRVEGGAPSLVNPGGRVRAVLAPRQDSAASAPPLPSPAPGLTPSRSLGDKR